MPSRSMQPVLQRVQHLIALSSSPNENEARNAAVLAVRLIRGHSLVVSAPARKPSGHATKRASSGARRGADAMEKIRSPLGGECVSCHLRYRAGAEVYWARERRRNAPTSLRWLDRAPSMTPLVHGLPRPPACALRLAPSTPYHRAGAQVSGHFIYALTNLATTDRAMSVARVRSVLADARTVCHCAGRRYRRASR